MDFQFYEKSNYGDGGNHFCEICNDHFKDVTQFLIHLHLQIHHTVITTFFYLVLVTLNFQQIINTFLVNKKILINNIANF